MRDLSASYHRKVTDNAKWLKPVKHRLNRFADMALYLTGVLLLEQQATAFLK